MTTVKRVVLVAVAVILLCSAASLAIFAAPVQGNAITSVSISKNKDAINIFATLSDTYVKDNRGKSVYLFELMPEQSDNDLASLSPIAETKVAASPSFSLPYDAADKARLLSRYVLASVNADGVYSALTDPQYISNPEIVAPNTFSFPIAASKKGLEVQLLSDSQMLGTSYAVINISIDSLLLGESSADSVSFIFDGKTYYVSRARLESLDHRIKVLSDSGTIVYLNIILGAPNAATPEKLKVLYYPEALEGTPSASLCAVNTENADAVLYYSALLNFLATRYTDPSGQYGFAGGWIIGYEVNSNRNYNYMGPRALADYAASYAKALRIADTMLRSVYSNGRVYVSVGNNFNAASSELNFAGDETLDYPARLFLERLNEILSVSGDIPWNLSINPYPSDPANTSYWTDTNTLGSLDTPFVTMNNISVITDFMSQESFLYAGAKRRVLVGSFGVSGEAVTSSEALQAAAFAYAYYTVASNDDIEALVWHRHVDSADESGLKLGLWASAEGESLVPSQSKSIYDIFKYIDTNRYGSKEQSLEKTSFALKLIGAASWSDLIPGFDIDKAVTRSLHEVYPVISSNIESKYKESILFDFSSGDLYGFYPSDNAEYIELRTDSSVNNDITGEPAAISRGSSVLYSKLSASSPFEYMGISKRFDTPLDISKTGYISLHVKSEMPEDVSSVSIMIRLLGRSQQTGRMIVYEAESQIKAGEWSEVTFGLADYAATVPSVDVLKVWIKPNDNKLHEGDMSLSVQNVVLYSASGFNILSLVLWAVLIVVIAAVAAFFGLVIRNQIRYRIRLRRQKQRAMLKEQARRQKEQQTGTVTTVKQLPQSSQPPVRQIAAPSQQQAVRQIPPPTAQQPIRQQPARQPSATGTVPRVNPGQPTAARTAAPRPRTDGNMPTGQINRTPQANRTPSNMGTQPRSSAQAPSQQQQQSQQQQRRPRPTRKPPI